MVDSNNNKEEQKKESARLILRTQTYADLRQIAKKNLKEAERVLAESGYQLFKNAEGDAEPHSQNLYETSHGPKEEE